MYFLLHYFSLFVVVVAVVFVFVFVFVVLCVVAFYVLFVDVFVIVFVVFIPPQSRISAYLIGLKDHWISLRITSVSRHRAMLSVTDVSNIMSSF